MSDRIRELREAGEKATAGPWELERLNDGRIGVYDRGIPGPGERDANLAFIALSRNNWDALLDVVEAAQALITAQSETATCEDCRAENAWCQSHWTQCDAAHDALAEALARLETSRAPGEAGGA